MIRAALLVALLAGSLVAAGPAVARVVTETDVVSPSGMIGCWAVKHGSGIECSAAYLPEIGELDTFLALKRHGRSGLGERGDYPGYGHKRVTLRYGDRWRRPGIRCTMRSSGLRCTNLDKHGFSLALGRVERF
jgi:hypothetical protein